MNNWWDEAEIEESVHTIGWALALPYKTKYPTLKEYMRDVALALTPADTTTAVAQEPHGVHLTVEVESSAMERFTYNPETRTLVVTYYGGSKYTYHAVRWASVDALLKAESKGTFLNREIKPFYRCTR